MSQTLTKPILLDETGKDIVTQLSNIVDAIGAGEKTPTRIVVTSPPDKTSFYIGEKLDLTGIQVSVVMSTIQGSSLYDITPQCTFSPAQGDALKATDTEVTVSWYWAKTEQTFTTTQSITLDDTLEIVSWTTGTDEQIIAMVDAADHNIIKLTDYWSVGEERQISLDSMTMPSELARTIQKQTRTFVLVAADTETDSVATNPCLAYPYYDAISGGRTYPSFIVQVKEMLANDDPTYSSTAHWYDGMGYMNSTTTNIGGWGSCQMRTWLNGGFFDSIPHDSIIPIRQLRYIFKRVYVSYSQSYNASTLSRSPDYVFLPTEKEVQGVQTYGTTLETNYFAKWSQYYNTSANKIKTFGSFIYDDPFYTSWWLRSIPDSTSTDSFCMVYGNGNANFNSAKNEFGISPCLCI